MENYLIEIVKFFTESLQNDYNVKGKAVLYQGLAEEIKNYMNELVTLSETKAGMREGTNEFYRDTQALMIRRQEMRLELVKLDIQQRLLALRYRPN